MTDWLISLEGTPEGLRLALMLALTSAFAHAVFGALQKGRHDPWVTRGSIDLWIAIFAAPVALFLVPWPQGFEWLVLLGALGIHFAYKLTMALAYERAAFTVVYPVVRGTGPLATLAFAALFLGEGYGALQWLGVAILSGAILALAALNLRGGVVARAALRAGLAWAFAGGLLVAVYTTYDAWGIRLTPDPFTFLAWFFLITAIDFPLLVAYRQWRGIGAPLPPAGPLVMRGILGALVAFVSFGGVMLATRLGKVGEVAALRETSTVFAAVIGWAVLGEKVGLVRALLMAAVAGGAIMVQAG
ncbi:EamA family transporter [Pseudorhodobacter sp. MZDSW-24AT]|uniref:EamA family transporter n=1 Tax=Pseudorhodobacter sp. MZDSW-24AT TaxID=2052957 RepID=UPI000C1E163B|nr:EamA family transporter [Pseudorhodobacter sp. MZDSW-24AT]PJF10493.1 multidrug transporter [Pseudorhodobacter sp. MZDSW-24AT]